MIEVLLLTLFAAFKFKSNRKKFSFQYIFIFIRHCLFFQPLYGIFAKDHIPFRFASGGGRELHFIEDREMEISEMVASAPPRFPLQIAVKR